MLQSHHFDVPFDELQVQHSMGCPVTPMLSKLLHCRFNPFISAVQLSRLSQFSVV